MKKLLVELKMLESFAMPRKSDREREYMRLLFGSFAQKITDGIFVNN